MTLLVADKLQLYVWGLHEVFCGPPPSRRASAPGRAPAAAAEPWRPPLNRPDRPGGCLCAWPARVRAIVWATQVRARPVCFWVERRTPVPFLAFSVYSVLNAFSSRSVVIFKPVVNTPGLTSPFDSDGDTALSLLSTTTLLHVVCRNIVS